MAKRLVVVVFLSFVAVACANASSSKVRGGVIRAAPTTFEVAVDNETRARIEQRLARGSLDVVRLVIHNLRPQSSKALKGVRVFIEKPDAGARTPTADPHSAAAFVLGLQSPETMLFNVAPTISRLRRSGELKAADLSRRKTLRVTFVPETWESGPALPKDFALSFDGLTLEVPEEP